MLFVQYDQGQLSTSYMKLVLKRPAVIDMNINIHDVYACYSSMSFLHAKEV